MRHLGTTVALAALGALLAANPLYADLLDPVGLGGGYQWFVDVGIVLVVLAALLGGWDHYRDGPVAFGEAVAIALVSVPVAGVVVAVSGVGDVTTFLQRSVLYASIPAGLPLGVAWRRGGRRQAVIATALVGGAWTVYVGSAYADGASMGDFLAFVNVIGALVFVGVVALSVRAGDATVA